MAMSATSSADNCLLGIKGLVCTSGILNSSTLGPQIGIGNSGGTGQRGLLNFGGGSLVGLAPGGHLLGIGG